MLSQEIHFSNPGIRLYESNHTEGDLITEHYHEVHQILYALEGKGKIVLNGRSLDFEQDNVAIIVPRSLHSIASDSKLTVLVLAFDQSVLEFIQKELLQPFFTKTKLMELNFFDGSKIRQLLRKMLYEQASGDSINHTAMKIFLSELMLNLARVEQLPQEFNANTLRAERLRNYIDTHYFELVSSGDLAAKLGISTRHINNIFKEKYQITPMQYLMEVRLGLAKKMLIETDKDIASICFEVGFESLSTFYRSFKNSAHVSPNKYRTAYRVNV